MCFRKNACVCVRVCVCVCVSVCLSVWPWPKVQPKPIDRSRSNSISRLHLQISIPPLFFYHFRLTVKIKGSWHKKSKFRFSQKWLKNICEFMVHSKPNNMTLSIFLRKIPGTRFFLIICVTGAQPRPTSYWSLSWPNIAPKPTNLVQIWYLEFPCKYFLAVFVFRPTLKFKDSSLKKKI